MQTSSIYYTHRNFIEDLLSHAAWTHNTGVGRRSSLVSFLAASSRRFKCESVQPLYNI